MALSEDQKAMLRLLAQREQGYDDLAALMGLSVEQVRAKVKDALEQLEAEGEPAPAVEPPEPPPPPPPPEPVETEESPPPPEAEAEPKAPLRTAAEPARRPPPHSRPRVKLPTERGPRLAIAAGALVLVALIVVLLVGGGGGSDDAGTAAGEAPAGAASNTSAAEEAKLTQAVLSPVDGGEASGRAILGRLKKNVVLQVEASGLDPSPKGSSYTVWLYKSPQLALRIGAVKVTESGGIAAQLPLPTELLAYVAGGAFDQIDISLTEDGAYEAEIAKARKQNRLPSYVGEDILRGPITGPALEAASEEGN